MKVFSIQSEMLLSLIFRVIVHGLRTIGLAPVSLQTIALKRNSRKTFINIFLYSKMGLFYNVVLSILTLVLGVFQMENLIFVVDPTQSSINHMLDIGQYILIISTAWFEIVHWAFRQKRVASVMNRLTDVHCLLSTPKDESSNNKMLIYLAGHVTFNVCLWITFAVSARIYFESLFVTVAICLPILVSYCFLVEYSIVLGYVAREIESLNVNLLTIKAFLPNHDLPLLISPTHNQLADIKLLHSIRTTLYEVSQDIADFFSLPILPIILLFFYMTVYNIYYLIIPVLTSNSSLPLVDNIFVSIWLIMCVYPLILLPSYVTKTTKAAKLTGHLVHKLLATTRKQEIITELEHFSLHLMHEDFSFTAHGFFTLNFQLLQSILGAAATYLVIIIQFVQSTST